MRDKEKEKERETIYLCIYIERDGKMRNKEKVIKKEKSEKKESNK